MHEVRVKRPASTVWKVLLFGLLNFALHSRTVCGMLFTHAVQVEQTSVSCVRSGVTCQTDTDVPEPGLQERIIYFAHPSAPRASSLPAVFVRE